MAVVEERIPPVNGSRLGGGEGIDVNCCVLLSRTSGLKIEKRSGHKERGVEKINPRDDGLFGGLRCLTFQG